MLFDLFLSFESSGKLIYSLPALFYGQLFPTGSLVRQRTRRFHLSCFPIRIDSSSASFLGGSKSSMEVLFWYAE